MTDRSQEAAQGQPSDAGLAARAPGPPDAPMPPPASFPPGSSGNKALWLAGLLAMVVVLAILIGVIGGLRHWFALHTGTIHGGPDVYYNFWSGFGSDLGEATLISAVCVGVYTGVRKVNCHTTGCWRIGHHPLEGTPYILCKHHHPEVPNRGATHEEILAQHHRYRLDRAARQAVHDPD
jgi:hypothetical protein